MEKVIHFERVSGYYRTYRELEKVYFFNAIVAYENKHSMNKFNGSFRQFSDIVKSDFWMNEYGTAEDFLGILNAEETVILSSLREKITEDKKQEIFRVAISSRSKPQIITFDISNEKQALLYEKIIKNPAAIISDVQVSTHFS